MAATDQEPGIQPIGGLSQVRGDPQAVLSEQSIAALLADTVARFGERPAVLFREHGVRWTWRQFATVVDELAAGLLALGLQRGDRLGIWSPNRAEWLVTQFATARIGVILVNINPAYRLTELEYALNVSGCRALVTAERFKTSMYLQMLQTLAPELAHSEPGALKSLKLPALQWVIRLGEDATPGMLNYDALLERGRASLQARPLDAVTAQLNCFEAINIQFTSGTTGNPKGATLTHHNVLNNARFIAQCMGFSEADSLCIPVPLYHCFGMVLAVLACVSSGARMVFPGEAFEPLATLQAVAEERCTALHALRRVRTEQPAHRHHGRLALPDRDHEARGGTDAHARGDHCLRHDRDLASVLPEQHQRSAGPTCIDGGAHPAAAGGQGGGPRHRPSGAGGREG